MSEPIKQPELVKAPVRNVFGPELKGYDATLDNKRTPLRTMSVKTTNISMSPYRVIA